MNMSILLRWLSQLCFAAALVFSFAGSARAASFNLLELYWASSETGNIDIDTPMSDFFPGAQARFTSNPDNATFANSLTSGVLRGVITCANTNICGAAGSSGYFARRAPNGNGTISAVTFVLDASAPLRSYYGDYIFVVIGDAATYRTTYLASGTVATSANADGAAIAGQLDSYFAHVASVSSPTVTEGGNLVHTVTLSSAALGTEVINFARTNISTSDADLGTPSFSNGVTLSNGQLAVPSGVTSFTVTYLASDDTDVESDETYTLSVGGIDGTGTITDNDGVSTVSIGAVGNATEAEGTDLAHLVTLSGTTTVQQTFTLTLTNGTTSAADYGSFSFSDGVTLSGSTLTVPAGVSSFTITLAGAEDALVEGSEGYTLDIDGTQGAGTITDNDTAAMKAVKTAALNDLDTSGGPSTGDTVTWTITVTNTGSVALSNVTVSADTMTRADTAPISGFGAGDFSPASVASLAAGGSTSFTASYTLTAADVDAGGLSNTATAAATHSGGTPISDVTDDGDDGDGNTDDDASDYHFTGAASVALVKTATLNDDDGTPGVSAGDTIDYSFTVTNTGAVTLTGITVTDPKVTVSGGPLATLAAGASDSATFTASYTITQADLDAGGVTNTATVSGQPPTGSPVSDTSGTAPDNDTATVTPLAAPASLALVKTATLNDDDGTSGVSAGDTIDYAFTVTNTGRVALSNVTITDPKVTVSGGPLAILAAGASDIATFTASYTITQADLDAGGVTNTATVSGQPPTGSPVSDTSGTAPDNDTATVTPLVAAAHIALVKGATLNDDDGTPGVSAGDTIDYTFTVTNTGAVTLRDITVTDDNLGSGRIVASTLPTLAPGADSGSHFTASYTVTAADVLAGYVSNQATAQGTYGVSASVSDLSGLTRDDDTETITFLGSIAGKVADVLGARSGARVQLLDPVTKAVVAEVTTDAQGNYAFIGLDAGAFCIGFVHDADEAVVSTTGSSANGRSDGDEVCGLDIVLGSGRTITGVDAVMVDPSGVIYHSVTRAPLAGATVTLLHNGTPVPNSWLSSTGDSNNKVTGADGRYSFLLQSPAQTGTYTLQVSAPSYETSTLIPAQIGALTPAIGLGVEAVVASASAPVVGGDTTHYLSFNMSFPDWSDATTLSKGVIHNHIPLDPAGLATTITLTKVADTTGLSTPAQIGDVIHYTITARNTGILALTGVSLDDPLTPDETLTATTETANGNLDPGETWVWTASFTLDASSVNLPQIENLATLSGTDVWSQAAVLESSASGNGTFGTGNGAPTVVALQGLIDVIRPELEEILRDDLSRTLDRLGRSFSGFARDAARRLRAGAPEGCLNNETPDNDFTLTLNDAGLRADGSLGKEVYDCAKREWRIDSLEASTRQDDLFGNQTLLSYTRRVEKLKGDERIAGRFWGVYASHSDINTGTADGSIDGLGLYGGLYGARKLGGEGMVDYYLGGALGRHSFTFAFPHTVTITAKGAYTYAALLAGAGLSRSYAWQDLIVTPRMGFDLAYAPGAQVSLTATQGARRQTGGFDLGATGSWRLFLESEFRNDLALSGDGKGLLDGLASEVTFTPSLLCTGDFDGQNECGFGLAFGLAGTSEDGVESWSVDVDGSATRHTRRLALQLAYARRIEVLNATLRAGLSTGTDESLAATITVQSQF